MFSFRDAPITRKLMLVILMTTTLALAVMTSAVVAYELITFRNALTTNTGVLAQVIGSISTSSLAFENQEDAAEVLTVLSAEPQISAAAIYDGHGKLFAKFPSTASADAIPPAPGPDGADFLDSHLIMFRPIVEEDRRLGTIYVRAELREMYHRLLAYGGLILFAAVTAVGGALSVSTLLQRRITLPIVELAQTARTVSERQDYSLRAKRHSQDEIGELTDAFNQMLTRIGEAREALSASEERLRLALEGSETGSWDWNLSTGRATWDDYMFPLHGIDRNEFDQQIRSFLALIHPEDRARVEQSLEETVRTRQNLNIGFRIQLKDGRIRHMASRGRVFEDAAGKPIRMSGVSMDVTAAKQTEEALQNAKDSAEAANRAKDEFLAILSHELRTPLTPVLTTLAMLEEESPSIAVQRDLELIRRNVEVEARLIDDLLDVTRISRGKLELHLETLDLRALVDHAVQNYLKGEAARKQLQVSIETTATSTHLHADGSRITQVLWNLLQNACKFTPDKGSIVIRVRNEPSATGSPDVVIEVADTGIGIDPDILPRIFDAFEQGERARTRQFGGLGLGLAISRAIVEMHGGSLKAVSAGKNAGATFIIRLPTVAAPADTPRGAKTPESGPSVASHPAGGVLRILLVEDHVDTADQLARLLRRAGYEVLCASSLAQARQFAAAGRFDLMLSDLGLPDGSGHELMREFSGTYHFPGIALSGYGMEEDVRESMAAGFVRHLTKPVNWGELKAAIQSLTGGRLPEGAFSANPTTV